MDKIRGGWREEWRVCVAQLFKYARGDNVAKRSYNAHTHTRTHRRTGKKENGESCGPKKRIERREREIEKQKTEKIENGR